MGEMSVALRTEADLAATVGAVRTFAVRTLGGRFRRRCHISTVTVQLLHIEQGLCIYELDASRRRRNQRDGTHGRSRDRRRRRSYN
jgi:hypothetical protein